MGTPRYVVSDEHTLHRFLMDESHVLSKTVVIAAGQGVLEAGTVLGKITASGKYGVYNNANVDGTETAKGLLKIKVDATASDQTAALVFHAYVEEAKCTGVDAAAKADLPGIFWE